MTMRVAITVPGPVYSHLERNARANVTSVNEEARKAIVRGVLMEWQAEALSMGASLSAISINTNLPLEMVMEVLEPVMGEGSPLEGDE
jgi:hypothetical protein